jgi:hypothetical protein
MKRLPEDAARRGKNHLYAGWHDGQKKAGSPMSSRP